MEPWDASWKTSAVTTLTGELVGAMERSMGRVCRRYDSKYQTLDSPDTRAIKVSKFKKRKKKKRIGIRIFLPSEEDKNLLCSGVCLFQGAEGINLGI